MKKTKTSYLRGYTSSLHRLAVYIHENDVTLEHYPKAIFTTSEVLEESQRTLIEKAFKSKVFDQYGLNDSGASAYEIDTNKYLLDFERSYIEFQWNGESHNILSTSFS